MAENKADPLTWTVELRDEWYRILKEDGFEDMEKVIPGTNPFCPLLKDSAYSDSVRLSDAHDRGKIEYYQLVGQFLYHNAFKRDDHREIWALYAEGIPQRVIAETLGIGISKVKKDCATLKRQMLKEHRDGKKYIDVTDGGYMRVDGDDVI